MANVVEAEVAPLVAPSQLPYAKRPKSRAICSPGAGCKGEKAASNGVLKADIKHGKVNDIVGRQFTVWIEPMLDVRQKGVYARNIQTVRCESERQVICISRGV